MAATSLEDALDDLATRFIVNVPTEELASFERICFQIEQAYWFYDDFYRERDPRLPRLHLREFALAVFHHVPILQRFANRFDVIFQKFLDYKYRVPVCGAVLLTPAMDKCLLVKGWANGAGWSFPRGKINQQEDMDKCAIREVKEEIGFDIETLLQEDTYLEHTEHGHTIRLYVVPNVPESTPFQTQTRKEISKIAWFEIATLPSSSKDPDANASKFWSVLPFVGKLRRWIKDRNAAAAAAAGKASKARASGSTSSASLGSLAASSASGTVRPATRPPAPPPTVGVALPRPAAARPPPPVVGVSLPSPGAGRPRPVAGPAYSATPVGVPAGLAFPTEVDIGRVLLDFRLDRAAVLAALSPP